MDEECARKSLQRFADLLKYSKELEEDLDRNVEDRGAKSEQAY